MFVFISRAFSKPLLTLVGVISLSLAGSAVVTTNSFAASAPNGWNISNAKVINAYTILASCGAQITGTPTGVGIEQCVFTRDTLFNDLGSANFTRTTPLPNGNIGTPDNITTTGLHNYKFTSSNGATSNGQDSITVDKSGINTYWYTYTSSSAQLVNNSTVSWKAMSSAQQNKVGVSSVKNVWVQNTTSGCPSIIVKYSDGAVGFLTAKQNKNNTQETAADATLYQSIVNTTLGTSSYGSCYVSKSSSGNDGLDSVRNNNQSTLESYFNLKAGALKGSGDCNGTNSIHASNSDFATFKGDVFLFCGTNIIGTISANTVPPDSTGNCSDGLVYDTSTHTCTTLHAAVDCTNAANANDPSCQKAAAASTCTVKGIGWIICPVVNFMAGIADSSFKFLSDNFLKTSVSIFDTSSPTYAAWSAMRSLANVAFVIAFMIIIFSQLTSLGITNYGVKKMLPRLVIAAILVNVSYFICQIAVDLSNILGYSLESTLANLVPAGTNVPLGPSATGSGLAGVAGGILAVAGTVALGYAFLSTLIPVLLAAVIALIMVLFILVARQALILLLIVISPLAFVAFLLPNTEQWYKKWQKTMVAMLMLFPIVAFVFGISTLASIILANTYTLDGDTNNWFGQLIAAAVLVLPLFIVPGLLKKSLDGVKGLGAKINGIGGKLGGALGSKGKENYNQGALARGRELKKQGKQEFRNRQFNNAMAGGDGAAQRLRRALGRGVRPLTPSDVFARERATQLAAGASAAAKNKDYNEAVSAATAQQRTNTVSQVAAMAATGKDEHGQSLTEYERAAAIDRTMSSGGFNERKKVLENLAGDKEHTSRELRSRAISGAYAKGDQNIFGVGFGDQILAEKKVDATGRVTAGGINGAGDLAAATVKNAADGNIQAEHLVQGSSATDYLVTSAIASGNPDARNNVRNAATTLHGTPSLNGKSNTVIDASLGKL